MGKKRRLTSAEKMILKVERELSTEINKQVDIIYSTAAVVLWRKGWRKLRIMRRFAATNDTWKECGNYGPDKSMMQMLEEETGIEMALDGEQTTYHEYQYLDGNTYNGQTITNPMQLIYMRQRQLKWVAPQVLACLCLTLHRKDGYGYDRIVQFLSEIDGIRKEYLEDASKYIRLLETETDLRETDLKNKEEEKNERKGA